MNGYFLHLARLALGTGPRVEPRSLPDWEGGWEEVEPNDVAREPLRATERTVESFDHETQTIVREGFPVVSATPGGVTNEFHSHSSSEVTTVVESKVEEAARRDSRATEVRENEFRETRETIRELVREARTMREKETVETLQTEVHRAKGLARHIETERHSEIERLVREVERTTQTDRQTHELRVEAAEPTVEIHIGRIEVRAPAPTHKKEERREKPKGVIELEDYLRERSRGAL